MRVVHLAVCWVLLIVLCAPAFGAQTLFSRDESAPAYTTTLFDGKDLSEWVYADGKPAGWKIENGYMEVRGGSIMTKRKFGDCQLHLEFWIPDMGEATGQARGNSGVYLQGVYEIQVLDSFRLEPKKNDCGAIYSIAAPMVNACRPPGQWQSYDILYRAPRFDEKGNKISNARASVLQNGVWIHEGREIPYPTADATNPEPTAPGPILLQDHGCPIRYRNIWIRPLDGDAKP
jgi:hypothetical protein